MLIWNPWHGCRKFSEGCANCYMYRRDASVGRDPSQVTKTGDFALPLALDRKREYKMTAADGAVYACMTSDFFLEAADGWRDECWQMMRTRSDLEFIIITKRIHRFRDCIPEDWGEGYPNVTILCTCENQKAAEERLPVLLDVPLRHRGVVIEPMLGPIHLEAYLASGKIDSVSCGGESGPRARPCRYEWILEVAQQCRQSKTAFEFRQTGAQFIKDGKVYRIPKRLQSEQARKAGIDYIPEKTCEAEEHSRISDLMQAGAERQDWLQTDLFLRIGKSRFRSRFRLSAADRTYVREKGLPVVRRHAEDFIAKRLAPAEIPNDGKQTPMRGHPVFPAQHACACCCRGCLEKWHGIPAGTELTQDQQTRIVDTLMEWIRRQMERTNP